MPVSKRERLVQANIRVDGATHGRLLAALRRANRSRSWSPLVRAFEAYVLAVLEGRLEGPAPTDEDSLQRFRRIATGLEKPREDDLLYAAIAELGAAARARRLER